MYHTSDCTIEKVTLIDTDYFNITALVKEGYTYGGYFKEYLSMGSTAQAIINGEEVEFTDNVVTDEGGSPYIGDLAGSVQTTVTYLTNPYTIDGTHMFPKNGEMYFLKEDLDGWLWNYTYPYPNTAGSEVNVLIEMTGISSTMYNKAWVTISEDGGEPFSVDLTLVKTLRITNKSGSTIATLKASSAFNSKGISSNRGFLGYIAFKEYGTELKYVSEGHSYTIIPYVETIDGITIKGKQRILTITSMSDGKNGFSADDTQE